MMTDIECHDNTMISSNILNDVTFYTEEILSELPVSPWLPDRAVIAENSMIRGSFLMSTPCLTIKERLIVVVSLWAAHR